MYVAQAEWRTQLAARWGATAFVGIGQVGPDFGSLEDRLPAAGVGVRYLVAPGHRVNLSADLAWNEDGETSFYLRVGEAPPTPASSAGANSTRGSERPASAR